MTMPRFVAAILNLVSAVTTGVGFFALLEGNLPAMTPDYVDDTLLAAVIAGAVTMAVQAMLNFFWWRAGAIAGLWALPLAAAGLFFSLFSWFGGAAGWAVMQDYALLRAEKRLEEASRYAQPLQGFAAERARIAAEFENLSEKARALAVREEEVGGTCPDDANPDGSCGPRCRLRERHSEAFAEAADIAARRSDRATALSIAIADATDIEAAHGVYRRARELAAASGAADVRAILERAREELSGPVYDAATRKEFTCVDPRFRRDIERVLALADGDVGLPATPPVEQTVDISDALVAVGQQFVAILRGERAEHTSPAPLLIAAAIELATIIVLLIDAGWRRSLGLVPTRWARFNESPRRLSRRGRAVTRRILTALDRYRLTTGRFGDFLAVPVDGTEAARAEAEDIVRYFDLRELVASNLPLAELDPDWVRGRAAELGHASVFHLYRLPRGVHVWARSEARNLEGHRPA